MGMRLVILVQAENFYLPGVIELFLRRVSVEHTVAGVLVVPPGIGGDCGKSLLQNAKNYFYTFGASFVAGYALREILARLSGNDFYAVLARLKVKVTRIKGSINSDKTLALISGLSPDLLVSVTCNQIFEDSLLRIPVHGTLNLHSSLLPRYRGLLPSFWVLRNGEETSGVSVFIVDSGVDTGRVLVQKQLQIEGLSQSKLIRFTKFMGVDALIDAIDLMHGDSNHVELSNPGKGSYYSMPTAQDVKIFKKQGNKFFG